MIASMPRLAHAQPTPADTAGAAYDAALEAAGRGDPEAAAQWFLRADELSPNPVALQSSLKAALEADKAGRARAPALGMTAVERAGAREVSAELGQLMEVARHAFAGRAGTLTARCGEAEVRCTVSIDGEPAEPGRPVWLTVGEHAVEILALGSQDPWKTRVQIRAEAPSEVAPPVAKPAPTVKAPPVTRAAPPQRVGGMDTGGDTDTDTEGGVSPAWFGVTLGVTAALGAGTIASAVDTRDRHDEFERTGLGAADGESAQVRTNVLVGVTAGGLVASVVLAVVTFQPTDTSSTPAARTSSLTPIAPCSLPPGAGWASGALCARGVF
jgi:hypothetical protein